jgi:DNA polymerase-3 subunit beta
MSFVVKNSDLVNSIELCKMAVSLRTTMPVLTNIKVEANEDGFAYFTGTDQEICIRCKIPMVHHDLPVKETTVNAERFLKIVKSFTEENTQFLSDGNSLTVFNGSSKFNLSSIDPKTFPDFNNIKIGERSCCVDAEVLMDMVDKISFASSKRIESEPQLCSVFFEISKEDQNIRLVATDKKKMAYSDIPAQVDISCSAAVPNRLLKTMYKLSGDVNVHIGTTSVAFCSEFCEIYGVLPSGTYPPYKVFLPKDFCLRSKVKEDFGTAVKNASIVCDDVQKVYMEFKDNLCTITAHGVAMGESKVCYPLDFEGEETALAFDPSHIYDFFGKVSGEVDFKIDKRGAGVFYSENINYFCVAMEKR